MLHLQQKVVMGQAWWNVRSCRLASRSTSTRRRSLRTATMPVAPSNRTAESGPAAAGRSSPRPATFRAPPPHASLDFKLQIADFRSQRAAGALRQHFQMSGIAAVDAHEVPRARDDFRVLFRLCANTDPQRDSLFTKGPSDVLDHATSEIASGSKLGIDATKKIPGEGFKRPWPPLIKVDRQVQERISAMFGNATRYGWPLR